MTALEVLKECRIDGNVVKLPVIDLDRKLYLEVKKKLELIGGAWKSGKTQGFVFDEPPIDLLYDLQQGDNRNLKKEFQFFATPDKLADRLVELADIKPSNYVLEPSSGQGAIIKAIRRKTPSYNEWIDYCELIPVNQTYMGRLNNVRFIGDDFLSSDTKFKIKYDRILANPPFNLNKDIDHIHKMYELLADGGRIVTIASKHWKLSNNKKETAFREWLSEVGAREEEIPAGAFKESGTNISTIILIIDK